MNVLDPRAWFTTQLGVSRETIERLTMFERLVKKWNPTINLVSHATLDDIWQRHFIDSAAVFKVAKPIKGSWVDLGSGGGFPGVIIALLAKDLSLDLKVTCIESDIRKCEFIRTAARNLGLQIAVMSRRIEEIPPQSADHVSARALAPLPRLLDFVDRHLSDQGYAVLQKGENWQSEVNSALETWRFSVEKHDSLTHNAAAILKIGDLVRA